MVWASFHIILSILTFFHEVSIQIFCPFFSLAFSSWFVGILGVFWKVLCVLCVCVCVRERERERGERDRQREYLLLACSFSFTFLTVSYNEETTLTSTELIYQSFSFMVIVFLFRLKHLFLGKKGQNFLTVKVQLLNIEEGHRKWPLGKHHSNSCFRQDPLIDAKIRGWKFEEKKDLPSVKVFPTTHHSY